MANDLIRDLASHINSIVIVSIVFVAIYFSSITKGKNILSSNYMVLKNVFPFIAVILFISSVLAAWYSSNSNHVSLGGLLPWNDANGYFSCAYSLLDSWEISTFCQRRPIYSFYLATLTGIKYNL